MSKPKPKPNRHRKLGRRRKDSLIRWKCLFLSFFKVYSTNLLFYILSCFFFFSHKFYCVITLVPRECLERFEIWYFIPTTVFLLSRLYTLYSNQAHLSPEKKSISFVFHQYFFPSSHILILYKVTTTFSISFSYSFTQVTRVLLKIYIKKLIHHSKRTSISKPIILF